ncbi:MAG: beta-ketoacyl-[acyl-carrier-protein] synthase family protein [Candidatus Polarisedimenticolia bacterium]|nr:beta-ketoacyl-[acyl-carrier-protein] synthase family protein [bacterium]
MAQRRVVVTGMGALSSLGAGLDVNAAALRAGRSGVTFNADFAERGFASQVSGAPATPPDCPLADRRIVKSSSAGALMALWATHEALADAALPLDQVRGSDLPVIVGAGTGSSLDNHIAASSMEKHGSTKRVSPYTVPHVMASSAAANVSVALGAKGESWAVSSACSTGAHAIYLASLLIKAGRYDRVLVGAAEEADWTRAGAFDAMFALSRRFNDRPSEASRPFAGDRDGFVISGGAGILVLEDLETARRRGARIHAELLGAAANSDGHDMVAPLPAGAAAVMRMALDQAGLRPDEIDYVNAHGTSTPQGDVSEATAMRDVFGARQPWISSTKSLTGHAVGAAGSLEAIYTILMLERRFLAPSVNVTPATVDPECAGLRLVLEADNDLAPRVALSNSFGFGGTNACLALRRWDEGAA